MTNKTSRGNIGKKGEKMISIYLINIQQAVKISSLCEEYSQFVSVDACVGRYIIDAASMLGLQSIIGNRVTLKLIGSDRNKVMEIANKLLEIEGAEREC